MVPAEIGHMPAATQSETIDTACGCLIHASGSVLLVLGPYLLQQQPGVTVPVPLPCHIAADLHGKVRRGVEPMFSAATTSLN